MSSDVLSLLITIITLVINGVGLIFVATQVVLARKQLMHLQTVSEAEAVRSKRQATIDFYVTAAQQMGEWRLALPNDWDKAAIDDFVTEAYDSADSVKLNHLARYLGFFEALAAAVSADVYDLEVLDAVAGFRIRNITENYRPFFERRRIEAGANSAYRELEWLGLRLRDLRESMGGYVVLANRKKESPPGR